MPSAWNTFRTQRKFYQSSEQHSEQPGAAVSACFENVNLFQGEGCACWVQCVRRTPQGNAGSCTAEPRPGERTGHTNSQHLQLLSALRMRLSDNPPPGCPFPRANFRFFQGRRRKHHSTDARLNHVTRVKLSYYF